MKVVYKYGTGQEIPEGAIYLSTVVEEHPNAGRFVWHYFLVEVKEKEN
jgi:hypothetical protein